MPFGPAFADSKAPSAAFDGLPAIGLEALEGFQGQRSSLGLVRNRYGSEPFIALGIHSEPSSAGAADIVQRSDNAPRSDAQ